VTHAREIENLDPDVPLESSDSRSTREARVIS
jgi:hypothetical protein